MKARIKQAEKRAETVLKKMNELNEILQVDIFPDVDLIKIDLKRAIESMQNVVTLIELQNGELED